MHRLGIVTSLCTILFAARPASADTILYATAATPGRVDGFCVHRDGSVAPAAVVQVNTAGTEPRRLLVANGVLYVGERDRVEAYTIGPHGGLRFLDRTNVISRPAMNVMDMAFSPDSKTLYVAQNGPDRIAAYPLDAMGTPAHDLTSCIQGRVNVAYRSLGVNNSLLYVSEQLAPGRIAVFPIDATGGLGECKKCKGGSRAGQLCTTDDKNATTGCPGATCPSCCSAARVCQGGSRVGQLCTVDGTNDVTNGCPLAACPGCCVAATAPISSRSRIQRPRSFQIIGDRIYVEEVETQQIKAFRLEADGLFPEPTPANKRNRPKYEPPGKGFVTAPVLSYVDLVHAGSALLASQFEQGRIDAYRLIQPDGRLPRQPTRQTNTDVRTSPVRMTVASRCIGGSNDGLKCGLDVDCPQAKCVSVLYVATGEFDRVQAFHLGESGIPEPTPFSETDEQTGSFPNDVALATLSGGCM